MTRSTGKKNPWWKKAPYDVDNVAAILCLDIPTARGAAGSAKPSRIRNGRSGIITKHKNLTLLDEMRRGLITGGLGGLFSVAPA
jgi:hypothetical protein